MHIYIYTHYHQGCLKTELFQPIRCNFYHLGERLVRFGPKFPPKRIWMIPNDAWLGTSFDMAILIGTPVVFAWVIETTNITGWWFGTFFPPIVGMMIQSDSYVSGGLKPPIR